MLNFDKEDSAMTVSYIGVSIKADIDAFKINGGLATVVVEKSER